MDVTLDLGAQPPALTLRDPEDFKSFKVTVLGDGGAEAVADGLRPIGHLVDEDTAMLEIAAIGRLPGARAEEPDWRNSYAAMIDFATRHGWVDPERGLVQAHCERRDR